MSSTSEPRWAEERLDELRTRWHRIADGGFTALCMRDLAMSTFTGDVSSWMPEDKRPCDECINSILAKPGEPMFVRSSV